MRTIEAYKLSNIAVCLCSAVLFQNFSIAVDYAEKYGHAAVNLLSEKIYGSDIALCWVYEQVLVPQRSCLEDQFGSKLISSGNVVSEEDMIRWFLS